MRHFTPVPSSEFFGESKPGHGEGSKTGKEVG
jgi:hypothetical protein